MLLPGGPVTLHAIPPALARIPAGWFEMGDAAGRPDEQPVHAVQVAAFDLGLTPVTNAQYARAVEAGALPEPPGQALPEFNQPWQPVTAITWHEAQAFADWLSLLTGDRWRLPSEAEWERAARGGLAGMPTAWGTCVPPGEVPSGALRGPWPVGHGQPNAYGLFDMGTVVHEWCRDVYRPYLEQTRPATATQMLRRASRGGSWRHRVRYSRPAARSSLPPHLRYQDYGFRVLREPA
jgi:formylglycine-generating enzyme required for sulfatase activity